MEALWCLSSWPTVWGSTQPLITGNSFQPTGRDVLQSLPTDRGSELKPAFSTDSIKVMGLQCSVLNRWETGLTIRYRPTARGSFLICYKHKVGYSRPRGGDQPISIKPMPIKDMTVSARFLSALLFRPCLPSPAFVESPVYSICSSVTRGLKPWRMMTFLLYLLEACAPWRPQIEPSFSHE